jgi:hypothetical protein
MPSIFSSVPKPPPAPRPPNDMGPIVDGVWMNPDAELHSYDIKHLVRGSPLHRTQRLLWA